MRSIKKMIAVTAALMCLTACGKVDDFGKKDGNATLTTTTTTTQTTETTPETETTPVEDESSEEDIQTVIPDDSEIGSATSTTPTTTTKKTTTTKATTTQPPATTNVPQPTETTPAPTEPTPEPQPEPPAPDVDLINKMRVIYNGCEFSLGDRIQDIEGRLGEQASPSSRVTSCLNPYDIADEYYFYGMTLQAKNGIIFSIEIMDNSFYGDVFVYTSGGVSLGSNRYDFENSYGAPSRTDDFNYYYGTDGKDMQVTFGGDGASVRIWIVDSKI